MWSPQWVEQDVVASFELGRIALAILILLVIFSLIWQHLVKTFDEKST